MVLKFPLSLIFAYAFGLVSDPMCKSEMIGIVNDFFLLFFRKFKCMFSGGCLIAD